MLWGRGSMESEGSWRTWAVGQGRPAQAVGQRLDVGAYSKGIMAPSLSCHLSPWLLGGSHWARKRTPLNATLISSQSLLGF